MPLALTFPGVYIEEVPSGVHTITGVATSITAFVGRAVRGPLDDSTVINSFADFERVFGGLWLGSTMGFAVRDFYLNGGSQAIIVRVANGATKSTITLTEDAASSTSPPSSPLTSPFGSLILEAADPGAWGTYLSVQIDFATKNSNDGSLFNLSLRLTDTKGQQVIASEKFLNVSVDPANARYVANVLEQNSNLARVQKDSSDRYQTPGLRPAATITLAGSPAEVVPAFVTAQTVGLDGGDLTDAQFTGPGTEVNKTGLFALEKADLFNLLCIPPYQANNNVSTSLVEAAANYCEKKRAFYLVDPPSEWTSKTKAVKGATDNVGTRSKNAAIFFPRLMEQNPLRDQQIEAYVPCGAVAGVFARTDAQRGIWKAPAGQEATLSGVPKLSVSLTDQENGELNPIGVNCLRAFPIVGRTVWGSRTLQGADALASEWKYIPVRRTALFLEESLYRGTKWVVFEPNDEPLWAQIRLNVGAFMHNLFRQGAFQGKTPREAYLVKCDAETTTQNDIDLGIVNILVAFAPLKPAEFVVIRIQQLAGQIQV